jgi:hypothetical protein
MAFSTEEILEEFVDYSASHLEADLYRLGGFRFTQNRAKSTQDKRAWRAANPEKSRAASQAQNLRRRDNGYARDYAKEYRQNKGSEYYRQKQKEYLERVKSDPERLARAREARKAYAEKTREQRNATDRKRRQERVKGNDTYAEARRRASLESYHRNKHKYAERRRERARELARRKKQERESESP